KHGFLNLLGWVVPVVAQIATMPMTIKIIGTEEYGLLIIATSFIGYYTIFELGLGQSLIKIVSEHLPLKNYSIINSSISQALLIQFIVGLVGAALITIFDESITTLFVNRTDAHFNMVRHLFYIVGVGIPITMAINPTQSILAGLQRFDVQSMISGIF